MAGLEKEQDGRASDTLRAEWLYLLGLFPAVQYSIGRRENRQTVFFPPPCPFRGKALKCDVPLAEFTLGQISSREDIQKGRKAVPAPRIQRSNTWAPQESFL